MDFLLKIRTRLRLSSPLIMVLVSLFDFLFYYIIHLLFWESDAAIYTSYFVGRFFEFAIPVLAAALMLTKIRSVKKTLLWSLLLALPRLIYTIPYYYLKYVYDIYDSKEAIALSLVTSIAVILLLALKILLFHTIMRLFLKKSSEAEPHFPLNPLDLDNSTVFGILCATLLSFVVSLGFEIYDTVVFFIEAGTRYRTGEILSIVGSYVFLIVAFILTHILSCTFTTILKRKRDKQNDTDN